MKEEQDVSGTAPPEEGSKTKKYIRIAICSVLLAILVLVVVMAVLRRCGT
jgi:hypothetical protein